MLQHMDRVYLGKVHMDKLPFLHNLVSHLPNMDSMDNHNLLQEHMAKQPKHPLLQQPMDKQPQHIHNNLEQELQQHLHILRASHLHLNIPQPPQHHLIQLLLQQLE